MGTEYQYRCLKDEVSYELGKGRVEHFTKALEVSKQMAMVSGWEDVSDVLFGYSSSGAIEFLMYHASCGTTLWDTYGKHYGP